MRTIKFKMASSKFFLALIMVIMTNLLMWVPMIVNIIAGTAIALMTGSEYVSLMLGIYGLYCGLNVAQKQVLAKAGLSDPDLDGIEQVSRPRRSAQSEDMTKD
jgi:hypothetical protein